MSKTLFLSAGDLSGDFHCSLLVRELLHRHSDWQITALAGHSTREAGAQIVGDTGELGVIGFASALAILPQTLKLRAQALSWLEKKRPDAAILCDWGGFNGRLLPELQRLKIPALYYFPPRSWQKTGAGGLSIAPFCAQIATPFEWSARLLREVGANVEWVGHPILETERQGLPRDQIRHEFGVADSQKFITLLPGSRTMERKLLAPHLAAAVPLLWQRHDARFFVAATPGSASWLRVFFPPEVQIVEGRTFDLLRASDAAIVKSGTSTLEAAVAGAPQVVVYDVPALLRAQVRLTGLRRKIPFVAMPNIILGRASVTELLGDACRAPHIAAALDELLTNSQKLAQVRADYETVRSALGAQLPYTATHRTADLVENLVG